MRVSARTLLVIAACAAVPAHADIYLCKDASGRTFTSDRPIPQCADRDVRQYFNDGVLKKDIPAPLTEEQQQALLAQQQARKAAQEAAERRRREDQALLSRYRNEDDIAVARRRDTAPLADQVRMQKRQLAEAEQAWHALKKKSDADGGPDTGDAAQRVLDARTLLQNAQAELAAMNAKYDDILARWQQLQLAGSSASSP